MSINAAFKKQMESTVKSMVEHADVAKETMHVTFNPEKLEFPEGVTTESLQTHVNFINETSLAVEQSTAELAQTLFKDNPDMTTLDGSLKLCDALTIQSQHFLKDNLGEDEFIYGESTTSMDYTYTEDQANWLSDVRDSNKAMATKLFSK